MKFNVKKFISPLFYGIILAQTPPSVGEIDLPQGRFDTTRELVVGIGTWIFGFIASLAVIAIIWSGIMYITAGGDTAKSDTAKKNLTWAIIGLVFALAAGFIVTQVLDLENLIR